MAAIPDRDFLTGFSLTTAEILYRLPDHRTHPVSTAGVGRHFIERARARSQAAMFTAARASRQFHGKSSPSRDAG
jgi:hypothetical protein